MDFSPEEFDEILNIFRGETEEIVQKLNNNLLQLESNPNNEELLVYLFRDAHSLKGAARMIGFNNIQIMVSFNLLVTYYTYELPSQKQDRGTPS